MGPQLDAVIADLCRAQRRLRRLDALLSQEEWSHRPAVGGWSSAECLAHLNVTSELLLPLLRAGLEKAADDVGPPSRYRRDPVGWLIWKVLTPSGGLRTRTIPALQPSGAQAPEVLIADFERLQAGVIACVRAADGLALDRVKLVSPFDSRVRYNLYSALTLVSRHQHRHLCQAERAAGVAMPDASTIAAPVWAAAPDRGSRH